MNKRIKSVMDTKLILKNLETIRHSLQLKSKDFSSQCGARPKYYSDVMVRNKHIDLDFVYNASYISGVKLDDIFNKTLKLYIGVDKNEDNN